MTEILAPGNGIFFMRVGTHARETLDEIVARKIHEIDCLGYTFWGYGGNTCHPTMIVQPFAQERAGDVLIVRMSGRLDSSTAQPAEDSFSRALGEGPPRLAVDLSKLEYISSAGLRCFARIQKVMRQADGEALMVNVQPPAGATPGHH